MGARNPQESGRKARLSCNAQFFSINVALQFFACCRAQLLVQMTSALQKSECCRAVSAAEHFNNYSATSIFACGMLRGWGLEGWDLGLPDFCLAGKCPNLGRDSIIVLPEHRGIIFQQRRTLLQNLSSNEFRTATAFSSFPIFVRVALLQNEIGAKDFFRGTNFLSRKMLRNVPRNF